MRQEEKKMAQRYMEVDITQGKEKDEILGPADAGASFQYVKTNIPGPSFDERHFMEEFEGCSCSTACAESSCPCIGLFGPAYSNTRQLLDSWWSHDNFHGRSIFECGDNCACKGRPCCLRVVYDGVSERLRVYKTPNKGFGLQSVSGISRLSFVCEYAGEVVGESEARVRLNKNQKEGKMNYLIAVKEYSNASKQCIFVDPCQIGNIGRFINHSCDPNLVMIPVRVNHPIPRLALFARRDIHAGDELTFDYSGGASLKLCENQNKDKDCIGASLKGVDGEVNENVGNVKRSMCLCGSGNCKGFLPLDDHLFDN